jgi:hypothetical protein
VRLLTDDRGRAEARPSDLDLSARGVTATILGVVPPARARFNVARAFFGSL